MTALGVAYTTVEACSLRVRVKAVARSANWRTDMVLGQKPLQTGGPELPLFSETSKPTIDETPNGKTRNQNFAETEYFDSVGIVADCDTLHLAPDPFRWTGWLRRVMVSLGSVSICVQNRLSEESGHGQRLIDQSTHSTRSRRHEPPEPSVA